MKNFGEMILLLAGVIWFAANMMLCDCTALLVLSALLALTVISKGVGSARAYAWLLFLLPTAQIAFQAFKNWPRT